MTTSTLLNVIGNTPLIKLNLGGLSRGNVYAKLELMNPFGMKDRVARNIIMVAERTGRLKPGMRIVESSSGTMACGVALVGAQLGYEVHIVTDPRIDVVTMAKLHALGCKVHVVKEIGSQGWQSARLDYLYTLMESGPASFWPSQYDNPDNPASYFELADELIRELPRIDVLVAAVGSGGAISGTAQRLRTVNPDLRVVAVDSTGSVIFGQPDRPRRLQGGLGNSLVPRNVDYSAIDEVHWLNDREAFTATLDLCRTQQVFAGNSSGSVFAVARWLSTQVDHNSSIVAIFPDRGDRYAQTIYNESYWVDSEINVEVLSKNPHYVPYGTTVNAWSFAKLHP